MSLNRVLADTSIWIFALRKESHPFIKKRVDNLLKENLVVTTPLINLELLGGVNTEKEFKRLKQRLELLLTVKISDDHWSQAARLAFKVRRKGLTLPYTDLLLSAIAIAEDIILLHADAHFDLIAKHSDLRVESLVSVL